MLGTLKIQVKMHIEIPCDQRQMRKNLQKPCAYLSLLQQNRGAENAEQENDAHHYCQPAWVYRAKDGHVKEKVPGAECS